MSVTVGAAVAPTAAQPLPKVDCVYTPVLPKRVVVHHDPTTFHTPVTISGAGCAKNFSAQEPLTHKTDTYTLAWQYNNRTSSNSIYSVTVKPGTYRASGGTNCVAYNSDGTAKTCVVDAGSTVIKFAGKAHLSADRLKGSDKDKVRFTVTATRYMQYTTKYITTKVEIQRKDNGSWVTVHRATAHGKHGYVWTETDKNSHTYRAVSSETSVSFAGTSKAVNV